MKELKELVTELVTKLVTELMITTEGSRACIMHANHMKESIQQYFYTPTKEQLDAPLYVTWAGKRRCLPTHEIGPRILDGYKLVFIVRGSGYVEQEGTERQKLHEGDMFVLFPRVRHYYYADPDDPWELIWTFFSGSICAETLASIGVSVKECVVRSVMNSSIYRTHTRLLRGMQDTTDSSNLKATGYMYVLFAQIKAGIESNQQRVVEHSRESVVEKAASFVEQNYYMPLDVDALCDHVNYSRSYLSRAFRQEMNSTIPEFITSVRIRNAKLLLEETDLSIKEVACSVGVEDSFYFSKIFKKATGVSPSAYKKAVCAVS